MDIVNKISRLLSDEESGATTTANVAINTAKGHIDVIGGQCPKGQKYDPKKKVCVPMKNESAGNPKSGDRFEYKGKKLTVTNVGSGLGHDKYITVQFDNEKHKREINMKNFFKGDDFKYLKEASVVGGSYIAGTTVNIIGSGQTRVWGSHHDIITDLARKEKQEIISADKTVENLGRRGLKFNHVLGAYVPSQWEK